MLNQRQLDFITTLKTYNQTMETQWKTAQCLVKCFDEEFADGQDNALTDIDADIETAYNFNTVKIKAAITAMRNYINYYDGNAVVVKEYGADIRRTK